MSIAGIEGVREQIPIDLARRGFTVAFQALRLSDTAALGLEYVAKVARHAPVFLSDHTKTGM